MRNLIGNCRMRVVGIIVIAVLLFFSCHSEQETNQEGVAEKDTLAEEVDTYFTALRDLKKFNGVLYVEKSGNEVINKAYNLSEDAKSSTFVTIHSQFDIHSISKLMAYYLILKLEKEGKVNRTQTVKDFISDFKDGDKITIEMLLNHTSGLPREMDGLDEDEEGRMLPEEIVEEAKKQKLLFRPGTDFQYSNVGYELIHHIISKVTGKTFAQTVIDDLFKPLRMESSGAHFYVNEKNVKSLAKNHQLVDNEVVQIPNILEDEFKVARIYSTLYDLTLFFNHIKKEPYASLLKDEENVIQKNGGSKGIRTQVYTHLDGDYSFVLLSNYDEMPFQKTIGDIVKILEGEPYELPKELNRLTIDVSEDQLVRFIGSYSFADMNNLELVFKVENKQLVVFQEGEKIGMLKAESEYVFFEDPKAAESFEFIENENGSFNVMMGWKGIKLEGKKLKE